MTYTRKIWVSYLFWTMILTNFELFAVSASPVAEEDVDTEDGKVRIKQYGNEYQSWSATADENEHLVVREKNSAGKMIWVYATLDENGDLVSTHEPVKRKGPSNRVKLSKHKAPRMKKNAIERLEKIDAENEEALGHFKKHYLNHSRKTKNRKKKNNTGN